MSLAQIGEFAFVLLSRASNLHLVEVCFSVHFLHPSLTKSDFSIKDCVISILKSFFVGQVMVSFIVCTCMRLSNLRPINSSYWLLRMMLEGNKN